MNRADIASGALLSACVALAWWRRNAEGGRAMAWALTAMLIMHAAQVAMDTWLPRYPGGYSGTRAWWQRAEMALRFAWPGVAWLGVVGRVRDR